MAAKKTDGRQLRWDQHNQERRRDILDAAIAVLSDADPGAEVHVQQIADRAGLSRTVVYRHFADRADLDAAIQGRALELMKDLLVPAMVFEGTPVDLIRRIVSAYVGWAADHPSLHAIAQQDAAGAGQGQMERAIAQVAGQVAELITVGVAAFDVGLSADELDALDPLVFGLVGGVVTITSRWLSRPERTPARGPMVDLIVEALWEQIAGMARVRGVELDPEVPVERLLESAPAQ